MTLESLQRRSFHDKEKNEGNHSQTIKSVETKFKNQIKEIISAN